MMWFYHIQKQTCWNNFTIALTVLHAEQHRDVAPSAEMHHCWLQQRCQTLRTTSSRLSRSAGGPSCLSRCTTLIAAQPDAKVRVSYEAEIIFSGGFERMTKNIVAALALHIPLLTAMMKSEAQIATAATAGAVAAAPHLIGAAPAILSGAVSSATAHAGTAVLAKLTSASTLSNGMKLPAGSQLLGHVTDVKSLASGTRSSQLSMLFDKVKLPNGQEEPMSSGVLKSIGNHRQSRDENTTKNLIASAQAPANGGGLVGGLVNTVGIRRPEL